MLKLPPQTLRSASNSTNQSCIPFHSLAQSLICSCIFILGLKLFAIMMRRREPYHMCVSLAQNQLWELSGEEEGHNWNKEGDSTLSSSQRVWTPEWDGKKNLLFSQTAFFPLGLLKYGGIWIDFQEVRVCVCVVCVNCNWIPPYTLTLECTLISVKDLGVSQTGGCWEMTKDIHTKLWRRARALQGSWKQALPWASPGTG